MDEEDLCEKCGRCCHTQRKVGRFYVVGEPCKYLTKDNMCSIYEKRLGTMMGPGCKCGTAKQSFDGGQLPSDCPYTKHYSKGKRYKSKVINPRMWKVRKNEER